MARTTTETSSNRVASLIEKFDSKKFQRLNEKISFHEYINHIYDQPQLCRSAYQRLYDMIVEPGVETFERHRRKHNRYKFFSESPDHPIFGLEDTIDQLVKAIRGAAGWFGPEKRLILLHGPVGSAKSTICRCIKRGLERYSRTDKGAVYSFRWVNLPKDLYLKETCSDPMHEDPVRLLPLESRAELESALNDILIGRAPDVEKATVNKLRLRGTLNPLSRFLMDSLLEKYGGDLGKVLREHIEVYRFDFDETQRRGIGTFQPKDEKNQDSTELTGDINFALLGQYGVDSDPRAFSFDGEFQCANRGALEFIEVLKLAKEFLYDLLGACQERQVKPKKFAQVDIDVVLFSHTNGPEYEKLMQDKTMEALKDRTIRIDTPYLLKIDDEIQVLEQDFGSGKVRQHIAPHTIEIAATWAVLTRLKEAKDKKPTLMEKAKLYNGKSLPGFTEETVKELMDKYSGEGMERGISARYTQNKISNALVGNHKYINPFMVLNELEKGLNNYSLIDNEDLRRYYAVCVQFAKDEYEEIAKEEVQKALCSDAGAIVRICSNYLDNVFAYIEGSKVQDNFTKEDVEPDERLMRSIEELADIPEQMADDFRRSLAAQVGSLHKRKQTFEWDTNPKLAKALKAKLFEDTKDHLKLAQLNVGASVVAPETQQKIDAVKKRLIDHYGYIEESATDIMNFVAGIFARGQKVNEG
jgi:serine protein kinase